MHGQKQETSRHTLMYNNAVFVVQQRFCLSAMVHLEIATGTGLNFTSDQAREA